MHGMLKANKDAATPLRLEWSHAIALLSCLNASGTEQGHGSKHSGHHGSWADSLALSPALWRVYGLGTAISACARVGGCAAELVHGQRGWTKAWVLSFILRLVTTPHSFCVPSVRCSGPSCTTYGLSLLPTPRLFHHTSPPRRSLGPPPPPPPLPPYFLPVVSPQLRTPA